MVVQRLHEYLAGGAGLSYGILMMHSRKKSGGFTMLELLLMAVVTGILTVMGLAAITLAKEKANRISCTSNLKQLNLAMYLYSDDIEAGGGMPVFPPTLGTLVYNADGSESRYMIAWPMLLCKSDKSGKTGARKSPVTAANCSYALNSYATPTGMNAKAVVLCDKNGAGNLRAGLPAGFGGNHDGAGGTVLLANGAALFYTPDAWATNGYLFMAVNQ